MLIYASTYQVRFVPDWMPATDFKRYAERCVYDLDKMVDLPLAFVKQQMVGILSNNLLK